jgi:hypothetical protein
MRQASTVDDAHPDVRHHTRRTDMSGFLDKAKDMAEGLKDKAEDLVEKVGDKLPDSVTDKIEKIIPGDSDGDGN